MKERNFEWGKSYLNNELAGGILGAVFFLVLVIPNVLIKGNIEGPRMFAAIIFLLIGIAGFWHYIYLTGNKTYISITSDGINVASRYSKSNGRFAKWTDVSKLERDDRKKLLTLSVTEGSVIKIHLASLNKGDREELAKIINEAIGTHPES